MLDAAGLGLVAVNVEAAGAGRQPADDDPLQCKPLILGLPRGAPGGKEYAQFLRRAAGLPTAIGFLAAARFLEDASATATDRRAQATHSSASSSASAGSSK